MFNPRELSCGCQANETQWCYISYRPCLVPSALATEMQVKVFGICGEHALKGGGGRWLNMALLSGPWSYPSPWFCHSIMPSGILFQIVYHAPKVSLSTSQHLHLLLIKKKSNALCQAFLNGGVLAPTRNRLPKQFPKIWLSVSFTSCAHRGQDPNVGCVSWNLHHFQLHTFRYHCFIFFFFLVENLYL